MKVINRAAITVVPKEPYIEWAKSLDDEGPRFDPKDPHWEYTVYLVRDVENDAEVRAALKRPYSEIFEQELASWHLDENAWPKKRDWRTFRQWFEVRVASLVLDLEQTWITEEEFET